MSGRDDGAGDGHDEAARAARLRSMGAVLREVVTDETDGPGDGGSGEAALRREVPPHHGD